MNIYLATALMLFGVLVHFLSVLMALEDAGTRIGALDYLRAHPYRAAFMVCISFVSLLIANELGQLTQLTAVLIGYACQDQADRVRQRANAKTSNEESST